MPNNQKLLLSSRRAVAGTLIAALVGVLGSCGTNTNADPDAASWSPTRPITIIVPAGPGGGSDQMARQAAKVMEQVDPKATIVVENVQGGGGAAGITAFLKRPDDGYTYLQVPAADVSLILTQNRVNASLKDFAMIGRMQSGPAVVVGNAHDPRFSDYKEMIAYMKESNEPLKAALYIPEGFDDLTLAAIEKKEGVKFTRVPYTDAGERFTALLSGRADVLLQRFGDIKQYVDSGDMVPLVSDYDEPPSSLSSVATFKDLGIQFDLDYSRGFWADAEAPSDAIQYMRDLVEKAATSKAWVEPESKRGYIDGYLEPDPWLAKLKEAQKVFASAY